MNMADTNDDTAFPERELYEVGFLYFDHYDILQWIKRCMEDTPSAYLPIPWNEWFNKWFSQFRDGKE